jgi:hypothetical protein
MRDWDPKRNHNNDRRPIRIIRMPLSPLFECQPFYYQNHVPMSVFFVRRRRAMGWKALPATRPITMDKTSCPPPPYNASRKKIAPAYV